MGTGYDIEGGACGFTLHGNGTVNANIRDVLPGNEQPPVPGGGAHCPGPRVREVHAEVVGMFIPSEYFSNVALKLSVSISLKRPGETFGLGRSLHVTVYFPHGLHRQVCEADVHVRK